MKRWMIVAQRRLGSQHHHARRHATRARFLLLRGHSSADLGSTSGAQRMCASTRPHGRQSARDMSRVGTHSKLVAMSATCRGRRNRGRAARLFLVAAAFVGLFAMHGLGDHGAMHTDSSEPVAVASMLGADKHASTTGDAPDHGARHQRVDAPSMDAGEMIGLCLAVLVGSVLALAWLRSRYPVRIIRRWPYPIAVNLAATEFRDRDPPSLFQLSIQRC